MRAIGMRATARRIVRFSRDRKARLYYAACVCLLVAAAYELGRHIVYLSKYLPEGDALWRMPDEEVIAFTLEHLRRMFPDLTDDRVLAAHVWRAQYAQPVVERGYRRLIPAARTPVTNLFLATMAQIYPEDRGTNYAVRQGREIARAAAAALDGAG